MKNKLFLGLAALGVAGAALSLTSCKTEIDYTIWVSETSGVAELTTQQIEAFKKEKGYDFTFEVQGVSEADAATNMITDVESGADIFCFSQDQLARLVEAGALMKLGDTAAAEVRANNDGIAVKAASVAGKLYCYPLTSDNGYFMYYDKSVVKETSIDSLEAIIADCEAAGKNISFELQTSAWYIASFFFATGCKSEWTTDETGKFVSIDDTFNSPEGLIAVKGMKKLLDSTCHVSSSKASDFNAATPSAVVVSGTWDYTTAKGALGDNFGVADLPSFEVDGQSYHLGSFSGNKLLGVKPQTDIERAKLLNELGSYLTNETAQLKRFEEFGWGPSNKAAQATDAVKNDLALSALAAQNEYAIPQGQIKGSWWDIAKVIATDVKAAADEAGLQAALDTYKKAIEKTLTMTDEEMNAWTVIGSLLDSEWKVDFEMTETSPNVWESAVLELKAGDELKVRQGKSWDVNIGVTGALGSDNVKVETAGNYVVKLTVVKDNGKVVSGTIDLIAQ